MHALFLGVAGRRGSEIFRMALINKKIRMMSIATVHFPEFTLYFLLNGGEKHTLANQSRKMLFKQNLFVEHSSESNGVKT